MMNVSNLLNFKEILNINKELSISKKDTNKPAEDRFDAFLKQITEENRTQYELTNKPTQNVINKEERNLKDKTQNQKETDSEFRTNPTTKTEKEIVEKTKSNKSDNDDKTNKSNTRPFTLDISKSETRTNNPIKGIDKVKSITENNDPTSIQTHFNLERLYQFLLTLLNLSDKTNIPQDIKDKIEQIKAKINNGKLNLGEISSVILEIQRFSNRPINEELKSFLKEFQSLVSQDSNLKFNLSKLTLTDVGENKNPNQERNINFNILLNLAKSEAKKDDDKQVRFIENPLQTQVKFDNLKLTVNQSQSTSLQPNFFIQLQMLSRAVEEFSGRLVMNLRNGTSEMKMTLFPPEIGKVFVKVETTNDGKIIGNIVVSTKEAYTLFQEHLNTIKENLANQGFNVSNMNLTLDNSMFGSGYRNNRGEIEENFSRFSFNLSNTKEAYETSTSINKESNYDGRILLYA
ncbi:MAG: flagellar hook-length control protein FliK [Spirochaetes bacterium]|nr:flagellar hook-length control protein FliK [Spirochaetota bacterium]